MGPASLISREQGYDFRNTHALPSLAAGVFRGLWPSNLAPALTRIKIMTLGVKLWGGKKGFGTVLLFFFFFSGQFVTSVEHVAKSQPSWFAGNVNLS